jgi:hypothetical protein
MQNEQPLFLPHGLLWACEKLDTYLPCRVPRLVGTTKDAAGLGGTAHAACPMQQVGVSMSAGGRRPAHILEECERDRSVQV